VNINIVISIITANSQQVQSTKITNCHLEYACAARLQILVADQRQTNTTKWERVGWDVDIHLHPPRITPNSPQSFRPQPFGNYTSEGSGFISTL
jgi:hypothetical protein